jgi:hypothetical protein
MESSIAYKPAGRQELNADIQQPVRPVQDARAKPGVSHLVSRSMELEVYRYHEDPFDAPGVTTLNAKPDPMGRI